LNRDLPWVEGDPLIPGRLDWRLGEGDFNSLPFGAEVELVLVAGSTDETLSSDPDLGLTSSDFEAMVVVRIEVFRTG
jgi:hypothetical protein